MKIKSLIQNTNRLEVAEVEIEFIPGIPQIHFLGLPDRIIKESFYRIKSALKSSGYKFPLTSQMIVNIKPNHLRKSSRGVELAVAIGILLKTEQVESAKLNPNWVVYGELGLDGSVYEPSDLQKNMQYLNDYSILTGKGEASSYQIESLKNFEIHTQSKAFKVQRPVKGLKQNYTAEEAEFIFLASTSGLHSLLAGDSGSGKSTLAQSLISFLSEPEPQESVLWEDSWRPLIAPHQSITPAAFLGGGAHLYEGEIERAQGGVLLLDELLEFDPEILEALRGPMTGEKLRISRASEYRQVSSSFQVLATTNLCPCGKWTPLKKNISCRFSRAKCSRYLERFSGPILDRFGVLLFSSYKQKRIVSGESILKRIQILWERQKSQPAVLQSLKMPQALESYYSYLSSRRLGYLEKVARIYALERMSKTSENFKLNLLPEDYNRAEIWVIRPFEQLEKGMS